MSIHSSLRIVRKGSHRSVIKRFERLKVLKEKGLWSEERSVLGLPKVKMQKLKIKKEKAAAEAKTVAAPAKAPEAKPEGAKAEKK
ncbi:MAG: small basic protein [Candidatus Omnitrophica bacterium]|nr:small basic protein [Candidatus Omnitrophota bacterium]